MVRGVESQVDRLAQGQDGHRAAGDVEGVEDQERHGLAFGVEALANHRAAVLIVRMAE